MADCLVVGGNGFLGSHVVDALAQRGHDVTVFDRFSGRDEWSAPSVARVQGEFLNSADLRSAVAGHEYLFHFLSTTTPATAESDPTIDVRTNLLQSIELFAIAAEAGVRRVFYASSGGAMYGDQPLELFSETTAAAPVSPYGIGKLAVEGYLRYFQRVRGLASTSFRISNPYGPRQRASRQGVVAVFLDRIRRGLPVDVFGDGSAIRDYLYAADAAELIAEVVDREPRHAVYNIGSGEGTSIAELLEVIRQVVDVEVELNVKGRPPTFVDHVVLDTSRYVEEFGRRALVTLADGVATTWAAVRDGGAG